jgi:hypothetical protein
MGESATQYILIIVCLANADSLKILLMKLRTLMD